MTPDEFKQWIKTCEGRSLRLYKDSVGKTTIGYGRNIEDLGITDDEAELMLTNDINRCQKDLSAYSWFSLSPENVQMALLNMCFNLGINKLLGFREMIHAIARQDYTKSSQEALNSEWAIQVGQRAKDVAVMMREN